MGIIYEKKNRIAYITLNRPEVHNAIDPEMILQLLRAWTDYRDDPDCLCAIITGAGSKAFCAGMDLGRMIPLHTGAKPPESEADRAVLADPDLVDLAMLRNFELYKPVIAAVNGFAIAGGMELVQATDIRLAVDSARFGLQEAKWAIFPKGGSTVRLPRQVPYCKAMEIMLTGELISSEEAFRIGFINAIVPSQQLLQEAERMAQRIARNGPMAVKAIKEAVIKNAGLTIEEGLTLEAKLAKPVFSSRDAKEGPDAFMEKREPRYIGG